MAARTASRFKIKPLATLNPHRHTSTPAHHKGDTFANPWPSAKTSGFVDALKARFGPNRNFVPVPDTRDELVKIRKPDWGQQGANRAKLKATWIGHASWLLETATSNNVQESGVEPDTNISWTNVHQRGVRILCDPVFSERTSPFTFLGPKRYSPTPCSIEDLPYIDLVVISHDHYDHCDSTTLSMLFAKQKGDLHFLCALRMKAWFLSLGIGIQEHQVTELDWWDRIEVAIENIGSVMLTCTPAQHFSARGLFDRNNRLWCSWVLEEILETTGSSEPSTTGRGDDAQQPRTRKLYFAGDTGYRHVKSANPSAEEEAAMPHCPAFKDIGDVFGPFDLALLPIGLCTPRDAMSSIHCCPEDSVCVHRDIRSKRSIGMHYGTVRGGISAHYEDVRDPPRRWKEASERAGLKWGEEAALCDIGETILVD